MEISGASSANVQASIPVKVMKETQDLQKVTAAQLIESLPDPASPVGQNVNVKV